MNDKLLTDADAALHDVTVEQRRKGLTRIHADLQKEAKKLTMFDHLLNAVIVLGHRHNDNDFDQLVVDCFRLL